MRTAELIAGGLVSTCLAAGCASPARIAPQSPAAPSARQGGTGDALETALTRGDWSRLRIETECGTGSDLRSAKLFGSGVGIWNGQRQFRVEPAALRGLLERFRRSGFSQWRERYGGAAADPGRPSRPRPYRVICFVELRLGEVTWRVSQLEVGEQFEPLRALAEGILETAKEAARDAVSASSLEEGLRKLGDGTLAPETFELTLNRRTGADGPGPADGFLLTVEEGVATVRLYTHPTGYGGPTTRVLSPEEMSHLAALLAEKELPALPENLWDRDYVDLFVGVLRFERQVQARPFAGMTEATHGQRQAAFETILRRLEDLAERVLREGTLRAD